MAEKKLSRAAFSLVLEDVRFGLAEASRQLGPTRSQAKRRLNRLEAAEKLFTEVQETTDDAAEWLTQYTRELAERAGEDDGIEISASTDLASWAETLGPFAEVLAGRAVKAAAGGVEEADWIANTLCHQPPEAKARCFALVLRLRRSTLWPWKCVAGAEEAPPARRGV